MYYVLMKNVQLCILVKFARVCTLAKIRQTSGNVDAILKHNILTTQFKLQYSIIIIVVVMIIYLIL